MLRRVICLLLVGCSAASAGEMAWQRRTLRAEAPRGYVAIVVLANEGTGSAAALVCEREGVELRAGEGRWQALASGKVVGQGALSGDGATRFFARRAPTTLMLGVGGRWVHGQEVAPAAGKPSVRVGVSAGCRVETFRLVAREQVSFADDFPDPEPKTELWTPIRGRWVLRSLSFPEQSANPAELAAAFGPIEDEASRGRTRQRYVGIGVTLTGGRMPRILRLAGDSPAERAGLRQGDSIKAVNGVEVRSVAHATTLLGGQEGDKVRITAIQRGIEREVELTLEPVVWGKTRRHVPIPPVRPDDKALIVAGDDFWTDYRFSCAVQTRTVGAFGLVFAWLGPQDYHVFRWLSAEKALEGLGRWQLARVRDGRDEIVAEKEGGFFPNDFYAMSVAVEGDALGAVRAVGSVDGTEVVEAADDAIVPGRIGLWAEAPGVVCFDDVVVGEPARKEVRGTANAAQRHDSVMRAWADPVYSWQYGGVGQRWWHKADFPGDVTVTAPVAPGTAPELAVAAERGNEPTGYVFRLLDDRKLTRLGRGEKTLVEKPLGDLKPKVVTLQREGRRIRVLLDGRPWIDYEDPQPLDGWCVRVKGVVVRDVRIACPQAVEYYFNRAPTEWHVMHGHWEVMNRWVCDPRWSFFGGRSDEVLAVWSKRRLDGNCFLDVWIGVMMFERSGRYENMRDIGLTICGDGRDLASGYTVIAGAEANRKTALFRNGVCVLTTRDRAALLAGRSSRGSGQLYYKHRGWIHLKLARERDRVRLYVWDRLVLDYRDPEPLPGGHAGIWSLENGLLLAKVRLAADRVGPPAPFLRRHRTFADAFLTNDCLGGQVHIERQVSTHAIANAVGGGRFAVALRPRVFSAFERPRIDFEIKLTPEAKIDLYLRCRGQLYRVILAGPRDGWVPARPLGIIEGVAADGRWHKVSFDLLGALRRKHPDDELLMVWEPVLANRTNDGYLLAGFGGNGAGATYWLRNIRLAPAGEATRLTHRPTAD